MIDDVLPVKGRSSSPIKKISKVPTTIPFADSMDNKTEELDVIPANDSNEPELNPSDHAPQDNPKKNRLNTFFTALKKLSWKQWGIIGVIAIILIGGCVRAYLMARKDPANKPMVITKTKAPNPAAPVPTTELSNLDGTQVALGTNKLPVTGVMIENSPDSRPQSGLKDAGVVFEAVAEGGITRFLALFQNPTVPDYLGPVRSVRPYYLDYLGGFDAAIAHVGGSANALAEIRQGGIKDLDQSFNSNYFRRVSSRYAPHNVYTSIAEMNALQKSKNFNSTYTGYPRKAKEAPATTPTAKTIDFTISGYFYNVHYDYDSASNSYKRTEGGKPHTDERSGAQLSPKVVIAIVVPQSPDPDRVHTLYKPNGTGKVYIFQDGIVTEGTWDKTDRKTQIHFKDAAGTAIGLNPGQTWVTLVGTAGSVVYKP